MQRISVVIPARNEAAGIQRVVQAVLAQRPAGVELDVIVVDDGSTDDTAPNAVAAGARVIATGNGARGNPGSARNLGAAAAAGDPILFLDADCVPIPGWLEAFLEAHASGEVLVGGSLILPQGLGLSARCDYYCSCYHVHAARPAGPVPHQSPANLSVRRAVFGQTAGFTARQPVADGHEELGWQTAVQRIGHRIYFEPRAAAEHYNDPGLSNLLRRSYRWGYSALQSKAETGLSRLAWLYRAPALAIATAIPAAVGQSIYVVGCWLAAKRFEPLALLPGILLAHIAYGTGFMIGGARWLRNRSIPTAEHSPRWR